MINSGKVLLRSSSSSLSNKSVQVGFGQIVQTRSSSFQSNFKVPLPQNEPVNMYEPNTVARKNLLGEYSKFLEKDYKPIEIPCIVNGEEVKTGDLYHGTMPSDNKHNLFVAHRANKELVREAKEGALKAKKQWQAMEPSERISVFLKAAHLLRTKYKDEIMAATMAGQGKTMFQAEIDSNCELIDFWIFNAYYAQKMYETQPSHHAEGVWNRSEYRALDGFVTAISPFNFTAIGANLCSAPAQMGNVVLWKPSSTALLSNYVVYKILKEAGLPDGVIQFLPSEPEAVSQLFESPDFGGLHFTGSTPTFVHLWKTMSNNLETYKSYPRIVGETGGKNYHLMHESADVENFVHNTIRGAFEYSGQKCSATSRAYIPSNKWSEVKERLLNELKNVKLGQPNDPTTFLSAVIDERSFDKISKYINEAKSDKDVEIIHGGTCSKVKGFFIDPTVIVSKNPKSPTMVDELFGPVLTIYVYDSNEFDKVVDLVDQTGMYGLTGAIFAKDRHVIQSLTNKLRNVSGNFYINDKCTGAVVGQQPFGGSRKSGTNDKAGSEALLHRWVSARSIKENYMNLSHWSYPTNKE